jgi:hypothetical protein
MSNAEDRFQIALQIADFGSPGFPGALSGSKLLKGFGRRSNSLTAKFAGKAVEVASSAGLGNLPDAAAF